MLYYLKTQFYQNNCCVSSKHKSIKMSKGDIHNLQSCSKGNTIGRKDFGQVLREPDIIFNLLTLPF